MSDGERAEMRHRLAKLAKRVDALIIMARAQPGETNESVARRYGLWVKTVFEVCR